MRIKRSIVSSAKLKFVHKCADHPPNCYFVLSLLLCVFFLDPISHAVDYTERALIVSYAVESTLVDASGKSAGKDLSHSKKRYVSYNNSETFVAVVWGPKGFSTKLLSHLSPQLHVLCRRFLRNSYVLTF